MTVCTSSVVGFYTNSVCDIDVYRDMFVRLGMFVACIAGSKVYVHCS